MEKWDIINKAFSPEDIFVIDGFKRTFKYGPENIMDCKCSKCGADQKVSFRFSIVEFFPDSGNESAIRARILPGKASKADAQRAKKNVLSKIALVPQEASKGTGGTGQRQSGVGVQSVDNGEAAAESELTAKPDQATVKPNIHQTGNRVIPQVPANLAAKILEEAKHEVELEIGDASPGPASFRSVVNQK